MQGPLRDVQKILAAIPKKKVDAFLDAILRARRVFVYGLGRSGLVARMFGMRLVHLGRDATIVGDTTTPAIRAGDLLVICSRTGLSPILHHAVRLAHRERARVVTVVGERKAPLASGADLILQIPVEAARKPAPQPMGSLFEQALLFFLDGVVLRLMGQLGMTSEDMERVHSNLP